MRNWLKRCANERVSIGRAGHSLVAHSFKRTFQRILVGMVALAIAYSPVNAEPSAAQIEADLIARFTGTDLTAEQLSGVAPLDKCGLGRGLEYRATRSVLSAKATTQLDAMMTRPPLPNSYASPGGRFRIHFTVSGDSAVYQPTVDLHGALGAGGPDGAPDYVNGVADVFDSIFVRMTGDTLLGNLGYPNPPSDASFGTSPDGLYDVYIVELAPFGIYGATYAEDSVPFYFHPLESGTSLTSFIVLENDFQENVFQFGNNYRARPLDAARVTAAHEFFHAIHYTIDGTEFEPDGATGQRVYMWEMTAVAMEELLYDGINDYYGYLRRGLPNPFYTPFYSMQTSGFGTRGLYQYGMGVFGVYLNEKFTPGLTRDIWLACGRRGPHFLPALDSIMRRRTNDTYTLSRAYEEFGLRLFFSGSRATLAPVGMTFDEAASYPGVFLIDDTSVSEHSSYPFFIAASSSEYKPKPEANSVGFVVMRNTAGLGELCFTPWMISLDQSLGLDVRLALIGIPCEGAGPVLVDTFVHPFTPYPDTVLDTTVIVPSAQLDSVSAMFADLYNCADNHAYDTAYIDTLSATVGSGTDTIRVVATHEAPGFHVRGNYETVALMVTQTSTNRNLYGGFATPAKYEFPYGVALKAPNKPVGQPFEFFAAYPNPSLPEHASVTFGVVKKRDLLSLGDRHVRVTVFTESGDRIYSINRCGIVTDSITVAWPLVNESGAKVASGVYIALEELLSPTGEVEMRETTKIAVIR